MTASDVTSIPILSLRTAWIRMESHSPGNIWNPARLDVSRYALCSKLPHSTQYISRPRSPANPLRSPFALFRHSTTTKPRYRRDFKRRPFAVRYVGVHHCLLHSPVRTIWHSQNSLPAPFAALPNNARSPLYRTRTALTGHVAPYPLVS